MFEDITEGSKLSLSEIFSIFIRYKYLIIGITVIITLLSFITSVLEKPTYVSKTVIMIEKISSNTSLFPVTDAIGMLALINNQIQIVKSGNLLKRVNEALKSDTVLAKMGYGKVSANGRSVGVGSIMDTYVIEITYKHNDPFLAAYIANMFADQYYKMNLEAMKSTVIQVRYFLEEQLEKVETELNKAETMLKDYKKSTKISTLEDETRIIVQQLSDFEVEYNKVLLDLATKSKNNEFLSSQLNETQKNLIESVSMNKSAVMESILRDITKTESIKASYLSQGYTEEHPKIVEMNLQIENLSSQLREESKKTYMEKLVAQDPLKYSNQLVAEILDNQTSIEFLKARRTALEVILEEYNKKIENLPDKSIQLARLMRNAKVNEDIYLMLKRRYEEAKLQEVAELGNVRIIDEAMKPSVPISPKKTRNMTFGFVAGLMLGIFLAFVLYFLDDSVKTSEEVENYTGEQILGVITFIGNGASKKKSGQGKLTEEEEVEKIKSKLIVNMDPHAPIAEAYRSIRTQLKYRSGQDDKLTYVVTSSIPGEGKSTTLSNLAITIANLEKKVLIIDADMRKPMIHRIFGIKNTVGLGNYLNQSSEFEDIVNQTEINYLDVITYGLRLINPSEMLEKKRLKDLLEKGRELYDYIFIDTPPVNAVTDAIILSNYADKVLWVVSPGKSNRKDLKHAKKQLIPAKKKILGVILNNAKMDVGSYYTEYYKKYYGDNNN